MPTRATTARANTGRLINDLRTKLRASEKVAESLAGEVDALEHIADDWRLRCEAAERRLDALLAAIPELRKVQG